MRIGLRGFSAGVGSIWWAALLPLLPCIAFIARPLAASDAYYQTFLPQMPPPTPVPVGQAPLFDRTHPLCRGRVGRVQKTVMMADKPRQAALAALENPCLGVTMASHALSAAMDAERQHVATCVDLYFETVAFSWNFLQSPDASARPEYEPAWQLYHYGLARLIAAGQRFGRLDPAKGLTVITSAGPLTIPASYTGFVWKPDDFARVEVVSSTEPRQLEHHYSCPGLGVPLIVLRENQPPERFLPDRAVFGATAVLRPSLAALAGTAPPIGAQSSHGPLELYDPLRVSTVAFQGRRVAMATDISAPLEYAVKEADFSPWEGLIRPGSAEAGQEKLFMIEPRQPGKYPLVFVHGFFSSPVVWANIANEMQACPDLQKQFQFLAYRYPTGRPFLESAAILRRELNAFVTTYDRQEQDPAMYNMALIGHSMGGLVSKLVVTSSDDRLWCSAANRPLSDINVSDEGRQRLADLFYFRPLPFVRRVVFMGTPHNGTMLASTSLGRFTSQCVQLPSSELTSHDLLIKQNPGVFSPEISKGVPSSIEMMQPRSELLQAIQTLCFGGHVQLHNIIGTGVPSPLAGCADGVVSVKSARHPWVSTEKRVHTTHGGLHDDDEAIDEIKCILRRHVMEANDSPETSVPGNVSPGRGDPHLADPCPDEWCPAESWPDELCPDDPCPDLPTLEDPCPTPHSILKPEHGTEETGPVDARFSPDTPESPSRTPATSGAKPDPADTGQEIEFDGPAL